MKSTNDYIREHQEELNHARASLQSAQWAKDEIEVRKAARRISDLEGYIAELKSRGSSI